MKEKHENKEMIIQGREVEAGVMGKSRPVRVGCGAKALSAGLSVFHANWGVPGSANSLCDLPPGGVHVASVKEV